MIAYIIIYCVIGILATVALYYRDKKLCAKIADSQHQVDTIEFLAEIMFWPITLLLLIWR